MKMKCNKCGMTVNSKMDKEMYDISCKAFGREIALGPCPNCEMKEMPKSGKIEDLHKHCGGLEIVEE